jgi:anti-sigma factor RsiW
MLFSRDQFARAEQDHLGERVADYVDGMLSADDEFRADIHLTVCEHCRYAVQQERAIIEQLRSVSFDCGGHQQLMAGLISLASSEPHGPIGSRAAAPVAPTSPRPTPAVVTSTAPPQYQSARKSMACALFAVAGCVGVALVASTATGVAQGPKNPTRQEPTRAALVRSVSSAGSAETVERRDKSAGSVNPRVPAFLQSAARNTP